MKNYLLILRDHEERWERFSPDEMQRTIEKFVAWNKSLSDDGRFIGAGKLTGDLGTTVRSRDGDLVVDGPFSEAKEAIAGYFAVRADSMEEAEGLAKGCPILTYGGSVEVRELGHCTGAD